MISVEFLITSLVVVLIPGTGVIYTVSTGLVQGRTASLYASLGCTLGIVPHLAATVLGLAAGHGLTALLGWMLEQDRSLPLSGAVWLTQELWVPALALTVAALAALLPVWAAYRTEAAPLLNER